jgi:hypothetical protein
VPADGVAAGDDAEAAATRPAGRWQALAPCVLVPAAGLLWTASRYSRHWYFFDVWQLLDEDAGGLGRLVAGHNDQLMVFNVLAYRAQRVWFGLDGHLLVFSLFCLSLVALHLAVSGVLDRLDVPAAVALAAGGVIVYFGPAAENAVTPFNQSHNFGLALGLAAAFVVLGPRRSWATAAGVGALLTAALTFSSSLATIALVYVAVLLVLLWPWRQALAAVAAPLVVSLVWHLARPADDDLYGSTLSAAWHFTRDLLTTAVTGLTGVGRIDPLTQRIGWLNATATEVTLTVTVLFAAVVGVGIARRSLDRRLLSGLAAGVVTALTAAVVLAYTRTSITLHLAGSESNPAFAIFGVGPELFDVEGSLPIAGRYAQWIALFLWLAVVPVVMATLGDADATSRRRVSAVAVVALAVVFVANHGEFTQERNAFERWGRQTRVAVAETIDLLETGCGAGAVLDEGEVAPAALVTVAQVRDLLASGALEPGMAAEASAPTRARLCVEAE